MGEFVDLRRITNMRKRRIMLWWWRICITCRLLGGNSRSGSTCPGKPGKGEHKILPHMVLNRRLEGYVARKGGSPTLMDLQITLDEESFEQLAPPEARLPTKSTMTSSPVIGDTGTTICCTETQKWTSWVLKDVTCWKQIWYWKWQTKGWWRS